MSKPTKDSPQVNRGAESPVVAPEDDWRSPMRVYVGNCAFAFVCTKRWAELTKKADDSDTRFCDACKKDVHLCQTSEEFAARGRAGECVAIQNVDGHDNVGDLKLLRELFPEDSDEILGLPQMFEDDDKF
jgi:hypothetical protein